ncbi:MAG: quinolinate synthase NadA [Acidobacteriota bacterium]|jgi:quinolinate synthase|nr:quinolinate synthase NadA [Acidobacteriota bacterium]
MSEELMQEIAALKKDRNAVVLAHTYQRGEVQDCADFVGDSYGLSVAARKVDARAIVFCGVRFMAETAAILNPSRPVILPEPQAGCPMADMITPGELQGLKARHPGHLVMCYVNSTAEIKALSDVCCTSSNAELIASRLPEGRGIIFVPDQHLGSWVQERTGREVVLWNGLCPTHLRITPEDVRAARRAHPGADVLMHPEVPRECRALADAVLSTGGMCDHVASSSKDEFVIATENGILHTLRKQNPGKRFHAVADDALCPNMKRGTLRSLRDALAGTGGERIEVKGEVAGKALRALEAMLRLGA